MNVTISPPQQPTTDPNVALECERAIDAAVSELVDQTITAGWPPQTAFEALKRVADRQAAAYLKDPDPADDPDKVRPPRRFSLAPF